MRYGQASYCSVTASVPVKMSRTLCWSICARQVARHASSQQASMPDLTSIPRPSRSCCGPTPKSECRFIFPKDFSSYQDRKPPNPALLLLPINLGAALTATGSFPCKNCSLQMSPMSWFLSLDVTCKAGQPYPFPTHSDPFRV